MVTLKHILKVVKEVNNNWITFSKKFDQAKSNGP